MTRAFAFACAILAAAGALIAGTVTAASAGPASCHHVNGPFTVKNGYMRTGHGNRYVPYAINLTRIRQVNFTGTVAAAEAEADAAASAWCANTVRFGGSQDKVIVNWKANTAYLAALTAVIKHAEGDGLAVVLTLSRGGKGIEPMPTWKTLVAWRVLAHRFGTDRRVIFDMYNEPKRVTWYRWRYGGHMNGKRFYGMEAVARWIRKQGGHNLLWAQGRANSQSLWGVPRYHLRKVGPVAYSVHHPVGPHTPTAWTRSFGFLTGRWPVVDGEWTNYSRSNAGWACWDDAPTSVPRFLKYLAHRGIGIVGYNLAAPRLIESSDLTDPTRIKKDWSCTTGLNEGAGHQLMGWFRVHNGWFSP